MSAFMTIHRGVERLHTKRGAHLAVANIRLLIGFAFLPAALKKVLGQPFTEFDKTGPFHDFLHAFFATGWFYQFVGVLQLACAILLMTQTWSLLGALMAMPILTAIALLCWSTQVYPTAVVVSAMWLATLSLLAWDMARLSHLAEASLAQRPPAEFIELSLWRRCGLAIIALYVAACVAHGGVYRPRGVAWHDPMFYVLPAIALLPIITIVVEQFRRRRRNTN